MYTVYAHINKINFKIYIGMTSRAPEERWGKNGLCYKSTPLFFSAIQKYGWNNFIHIILYKNLTKEDAEKLEKELIIKYKTQDKEYGYNVLEGGESPRLTKEVREKISKAMIGNQNNLGNTCSEETKVKISTAQKGRKLTEEHKKKLSEAARNRHVPCSQHKKEKLSQSYPYKKKVFCVENQTVYESIHECARQLNLYATSIAKVCKGKIKTTGNYHFIYFDK